MTSLKGVRRKHEQFNDRNLVWTTLAALMIDIEQDNREGGDEGPSVLEL
jgi:hypothetical protein